MSSDSCQPRALDAEGAIEFFDVIDDDEAPIPVFSASDLTEGESTDSKQSSSEDDNGSSASAFTFGREEHHVAVVPGRRRNRTGQTNSRNYCESGDDSQDDLDSGDDDETDLGCQDTGRGARTRTNRRSATRGRRGKTRAAKQRSQGRKKSRPVFKSMWDTPDQTESCRPNFTPEREPGVHIPGNVTVKREVDFFKLFFTYEIISSICEFTNAYAHHHIQQVPYYGDKFGAWTDCTAEEMYKFVATILLMGLNKLPEIADYYSTLPLFHGHWARAVIPSRKRFTGLLTFFKIVDCFAEVADDRLRKVRFLYDHMRTACKSLFQPSQDVALDERIVRSKGRFVFRQYLPKKPVKWGTKIFALCDSKTSYCYDFMIYSGQEVPGERDVGMTQRVVEQLSQPLQNQGYVMFTDNFYTSGALAKSLRAKGTQLVGTIKLNRTGVPASLKENIKQFDKHAERGTMRYARDGPILYVQWKDKRSVTVLSTIHSAVDSVNIIRNTKVDGQHVALEVKQPQCISDYNSCMGGVDVFDQHIAAYRSLRKSNKYWKSIAVDMLEVAVVNSYLLFNTYRAEHPEEIQRGSRYTAREFRRRLICQLANIDEHCAEIPKFRRGRPSAAVEPVQPALHLVEYTETERTCKYCSRTDGKHRNCNTRCATCGVHLHANHRNCFMLYHA